MFDMSINRVNKDTFLIGIFLYMLPYFYSDIRSEQKWQSVFCCPNQMYVNFYMGHYKFWLKPFREYFQIPDLKVGVINKWVHLKKSFYEKDI